MLVAFSVVVHYLRAEVNLFGVFFYFFASVWYLGAYQGQCNVFGETSWIGKHIRIKGYDYRDLLLRKSTEYLIKLAMSLLLFIIGAVMVVTKKTHAGSLQMVNIMLPVLTSALVILTNTLILIKITWRSMSTEKLQVLMLIAKRLGHRWESIVTFLMLAGNLVVFLISGALIL